MEIKIDFRDNVGVLKLNGELDMATADYLISEFSELKSKTNKIIFDFSGVAFVDSTGVGSLIKLFKDNKELKLLIANLQTDVEEIFDILNLSVLLGKGVFKHNLEDALDVMHE